MEFRIHQRKKKLQLQWSVIQREKALASGEISMLKFCNKREVAIINKLKQNKLKQTLI